MRVALYARVSTDRQEKERTIGSQLEALQVKAAAEGWSVEMTCTDDGFTGTRLDRPGLDRVRDAAAARLIDAVVVLCADRLARNYVHQALVLDELARFEVSVVFVEGGVADDPHGRLLAQIQAAVAEFERTKIVERNRRGKLWRARQGAVVSGVVPYGYRKIAASDGLPARLVIHEGEAKVVRLIFDWHVNDAVSVRQIAIRLIEAGVPSPRGNTVWQTSTLDRMLRQEAYSGTLYYNRRSELPDSARVPRHTAGHRPLKSTKPKEEWVGVAVPPIVDAAIWARSQARHQLNTRFSPRHVGAERYLLRYLVRCGECGQARASGGKTHTNGREDRYYRCQAVLPMHLREEKLRCSQPAARADELDELVWAEVVRHLRHPELIARACMQTPDDATPVTEHQLAELQSQQRRLVDAYQAGAITLDDLEARRRPLADRIGELELTTRDGHERRMTRAELIRRIDEFADQITERLDTMTFAQRQELLRTVLDRVVLTEQRVELRFKIPLPTHPKEGRSRRSRLSSGLRSPRQEPRGLRLRPPTKPQARGDRPSRHARPRRGQGQRRVPRPARHRQDPPGHGPGHPGLSGRTSRRLRHRRGVGGSPRRRPRQRTPARRAHAAGADPAAHHRRGRLHPLRRRSRQPVLPAHLRPLRAGERHRHLQQALRESAQVPTNVCKVAPEAHRFAESGSGSRPAST